MSEDIVEIVVTLDRNIVEILEYESQALNRDVNDLLSLILRRRYSHHFYI